MSEDTREFLDCICGQPGFQSMTQDLRYQCHCAFTDVDECGEAGPICDGDDESIEKWNEHIRRRRAELGKSGSET